MALETITEINLDINQPGLEVVHAKQYDTVRKVKAHLFYNGVKWLVPSSNYIAVVAFKKADRIGGFYDETEESEKAVSVDSNDRSIITILLDRNTLTTVGNVSVEVTFYDSISSGRLSTFSFILQVEAASLTELDLASNPYFNILSDDIRAVLEAEQNLTGLTATASKIAPGATPTVTVSGGRGTGTPYNLAFGVPTFAGITATASGLAAGATPTATVSGGTSGTSKYNIAFGIPKGDKGDKPVPTHTDYAYAVSTSATTVPSSGWTSTPAPQQGKYLWARAIATWDSGGTSTTYNVAYIAVDGTGSTAAEIIAADHQTVQEHLDDIENNKDLVLDIDSFSSLPKTITNSAITENHVVSEAILGTPSAQSNDWNVATANGSATISGTISGSTTLRLVLTKATSYSIS